MALNPTAAEFLFTGDVHVTVAQQQPHRGRGKGSHGTHHAAVPSAHGSRGRREGGRGRGGWSGDGGAQVSGSGDGGAAEGAPYANGVNDGTHDGHAVRGRGRGRNGEAERGRGRGGRGNHATSRGSQRRRTDSERSVDAVDAVMAGGVNAGPVSSAVSSSPGRPAHKRGDASHLLNFQFSSGRVGGGYGGGGGAGTGTGPPPAVRRPKKRRTYNKEHYVQAHCQFMVRASGDYTSNLVDPDYPVEWDLIEEVRMFAHSEPVCPICLQHPSAGKTTRCGHVFCHSCVLRYLSTAERSWKKCPICFEAIHAKDLRSVTVVSRPVYTVGDTVTMRLMRRPKTSTVCAPKAQWDDSLTQQPPPPSHPAGGYFVKLLVVTPSDVLATVVQRERNELLSQLSEATAAGETEDVAFIEQALMALNVRETGLASVATVGDLSAKLSALVTSDQQRAPRTEQPSTPERARVAQAARSNGDSRGGSHERVRPAIRRMSEGRDDASAAFFDIESLSNGDVLSDTDDSEEEDEGKGEEGDDAPPQEAWHGGVDVDAETVANAGEPNGRTVTEGPVANGASTESRDAEKGDEGKQGKSRARDDLSAGDAFYFYQAADGQHVYLHPVNSRCLADEFGALSECPDTVSGKVVEVEEVTQSTDMRGRYRFLSHLPLSCEYAFVELDLKHVLSRETLAAHQDELSRRKARRQSKQRQERTREKRLQEAAQAPRMTSDIHSTLEFPSAAAAASAQDVLSPYYSASSLPSLSGRGGLGGDGAPVVVYRSTPDEAVAAHLEQVERAEAAKPEGYVVPSFSQAVRAGYMSNHDENPTVAEAMGRAPSTTAPSASQGPGTAALSALGAIPPAGAPPARTPTKAPSGAWGASGGSIAARLQQPLPAQGHVTWGHRGGAVAGRRTSWEDEGDGFEPPSYKSSFSESVSRAFSREETASGQDLGGDGAVGKGQKKKKVVLFSTSAARKY